MKLTLDFRNELYGIWETAQGYLVENFDHVISQITAGYGKEHNADDTHGDVTADSVTTPDLTVSLSTDFSGVVQVNTDGHLRVALTASVNNYTPTGFATSCVLLNIDSNGAYNITGLVAATVGTAVRVVHVVNISAFTITLTHEDGASTAANRFAMPNAANLAIRRNGGATLVYLPAGARWYALSQ